MNEISDYLENDMIILAYPAESIPVKKEDKEQFMERYFNDIYHELGFDQMVKFLLNPVGNVLADFSYNWDYKISNMGWICLEQDYKDDCSLA